MFSPKVENCPICGSVPREFELIDQVAYWRCETCLATFMDPANLPTPSVEKDEYTRHNNRPDDPGYRKFLSKLFDPMVKKLKLGMKGLDYGCGPGPALAQMFEEQGFLVWIYDPLFFPENELFAQQFDFITCTEVIEHFHRPAEEFARLDKMLKPGAWLAVMTCFQTDDSRFATWHYRRDPTHVVFYREETLRVIAERFGWEVEFPVKDVAIMRKVSE